MKEKIIRFIVIILSVIISALFLLCSMLFLNNNYIKVYAVGDDFTISLPDNYRIEYSIDGTIYQPAHENILNNISGDFYFKIETKAMQSIIEVSNNGTVLTPTLDTYYINVTENTIISIKSIGLSGFNTFTGYIYGFTASSYQWQSSTDNINFSDIVGQTSLSYEVQTYSAGNTNFYRLKVDNIYFSSSVRSILFDISQEDVLIDSYSGFSGKNNSGTTLTGQHSASNIYVISGSSGKSGNTIIGNGNYVALSGQGDFVVVLHNLEICTGTADLQGKGAPITTRNVTSGKVTVLLSETNYLANLKTLPSYTFAAIEKNTENFTLEIDCIHCEHNHSEGKCENCGKITAIGGADSTGIGGSDTNNLLGGTNNITILGGEIIASTQASEGAGIGAGNNKTAENIRIYGGKITSVGFDNGAGIGGSGGKSGYGMFGSIYVFGGNIYAYSNNDGSGIGGGGSDTGLGGEGIVHIYGGVIDTSSIGGGSGGLLGGLADIIITSGKVTTNIIGGGNSNDGEGGSATITITGGTINSNSIGGGNSNDGEGGSATITITGGTINSNSIGVGYSNAYGYETNSNVTITGGSVNSSIAGIPTNGTEQIYLTRVALYAKDALNPSSSIAIVETKVDETSLNVENASYYGDNDMYTDENAFLYLWLPEEAFVVSCDMIVDGEPATFDGAVYAKSIGVLKNDEILFYVVNIASHEGYELYYKNAKFDGSMIVRADSGFAFEMELIAGTTLNQGYRSTINGTVSNLTHISNNNGRYQYQFTANANTYVWFAVTKDSVKRLVLDLYAGDIIMETGTNNNTHKVTYAGYVLDNYVGAFYISSNFYPASNTVNILSGTHDIYIDKLIANHGNSIFTIERNAVLNLSASTENNQISSSCSSAITVNTNGTLNLIINKIENLRYASLKLNGGDNCSVIGGNGNVNITKQDGFLELNLAEGCTKSQVSAQKYSYTTNSLSGAIPYSLTMTGGKFVGYKKSGNGLSLPNATHTISTETTFTACAISYVKSDSVLCEEDISLNNLDVVITLSGSITIGSIIVKRESITLIENTSWTYDSSNKTITILGSETYNNLKVEIITSGEIVYMANDYSGVYDGLAHSISVIVSSPSAYTIMYSLNNVNFSENQITCTDVCNITIYWKITSNGYTTEVGNNTIVITKNYNSWNLSLVCPSLLAGGVPNPHAESKFGNENLIFTYYEFDSTNLTLSELASVPTTAGEYYVKASVAETMNYYELTSNYVVFVIKNNITYISSELKFTEINVQGGQIDIYSNKYATVLYDFYYYVNAGELALYADNLPVGTKIVFIDYSSDVPIFYYLILTTNMDEILLSNFNKMGTTNAFSYPITNDYIRGKFQFCLTLPANNNIGTTSNPSGKTLILEQNSATKGSVVLNLLGAFSLTETVATPTLSAEDNCLEVDSTILANDADNQLNKVLVYTLLDSSGNDVVLVDNNGDYPTIQPDSFAELYFNNDIDNKYIQYFNENKLFFDLGTANINNKVAHLIIHNLKSNNYKFEINVRVTDVDSQYCLNNPTVNNQKQSAVITFTHFEQISIKATRVVENNPNQDRIIDKNISKSMQFNIDSLGYDLSSLEVELYKKNSGNYSYLQDISFSIASTTNANSKKISFIVPSLSVGTYRLKFIISDAYDLYYIEYTFLVK